MNKIKSEFNEAIEDIKDEIPYNMCVGINYLDKEFNSEKSMVFFKDSAGNKFKTPLSSVVEIKEE